jgi:DNA-binding NarL/FixJ family response regulator
MVRKSENIRILIVSSHTMFRDGLKQILNAEPGFNVIADAGNKDQSEKLLDEQTPDVLLLDLNDSPPHACPNLQILECLGEKKWKILPILLIPSYDEEQIVEALKMGVRGIFRKQLGTSLLFKCIRSVMRGEYWMGHDVTCGLINSLKSLHKDKERGQEILGCGLSARELQVIQEIAFGSSNKDIAQTLSISEQAVKYRLSNIFRKTGISDRMELARFVIRHQLVREA